MKLVFRADASLIAGTGHVMRLYAIAEEALNRGLDCDFVGNYLEVSWLSEKINSLGFTAINPEMINYRELSSDSVLIIDSYTIAADDKFISDGNWRSVVAIVDKETPAYNCDLAIHPGLSASWNHAHFINFFYGPQFVPVRQEILKLKTDLKYESRKINKILVVGGGTDPFNFNLSIAQKLSIINGNFECVFLTKNEKDIINIDPRFICKEIGPSLIKELESADLVISTASTSSLEFLALNKLTATCAIVDNQIEHYSFLEENNLSQCLGILDEENDDYISANALREIIEYEPRRKLIRENINSLVDGFGAKRIVDLIVDLDLSKARGLQ